MNRDRLFQPTGQPSFEQWHVEDVEKAISQMVELSMKQHAGGGSSAGGETAIVVRGANTSAPRPVALRVGWKEYYQVLAAAEEERRERDRVSERLQWHPSTIGYTMARDADAQALLEEYQRGKVRVTCPSEYN